MLDINYCRSNSEEIKAKLSRKKFHFDLDKVMLLDEKRREAISASEQARAGQKAANNEMSQLAKGSAEFLAKVAEMKELAGKG